MTRRTATQCSRCYRDATIRVIGKWGNGHPAIDLRCASCAPDASHVGTWTSMGVTHRGFVIERMEPVP